MQQLTLISQVPYKQPINIHDPNDWPTLDASTLNGVDKNSSTKGKSQASDEMVETTVLEETKNFSKLVISKERKDRNNNEQASSDSQPAVSNCASSSSEEEKTEGGNESASGGAAPSKSKKKSGKGKWKPLQIETYSSRSHERRRFERIRDGRSANGSSNANGGGRSGRKEQASNGHQVGDHPPQANGFSRANGHGGKQKSHVVQPNNGVPLIPNGAPASVDAENAAEGGDAERFPKNHSAQTAAGPNLTTRQPRRPNASNRLLRQPRPLINGGGFRHRGRLSHFESGNVTPLSDYENYYMDVSQALPAAALSAGFVTPYFAPFQPRLDPEALDNFIRQQIEYYFSEENLHGDLFLRRKMDKQGYLPISLIASFYRVQALTKNFLQIVEALKKSEKVELSECQTKVRTRANPERWPLFDQRFTITTSVPSAAAAANNAPVEENSLAAPAEEMAAAAVLPENVQAAAPTEPVMVAAAAPTPLLSTLHTDLHPNVPIFLPGQPYGYGYDGPNTGEFVPPPPAMLCMPKPPRMCRYSPVPAHLLHHYAPIPLGGRIGGRRSRQHKESREQQQQQQATQEQQQSTVVESNNLSGEKVLSYSDAIKQKAAAIEKNEKTQANSEEETAQIKNDNDRNESSEANRESSNTQEKQSLPSQASQ